MQRTLRGRLLRADASMLLPNLTPSLRRLGRLPRTSAARAECCLSIEAEGLPVTAAVLLSEKPALLLQSGLAVV